MLFVRAFGRQPELVLAIPPEGTRSRVSEWKTGFYYIAQRAGVPVLPVYVDGARKVVGIAPLFYPTGDLEGDLPKIRAIYAGKQGIRAELS